MPKHHFKGRFLHLVTRDVRLPNGSLKRIEKIIHNGAVVIVSYLTADTVIMLKQYRAVIDEYIYELPAGTLAKNEKPRRCANRELMEETGYYARKIKKIGVLYPAPGYSTEKLHIYKAQKLVARYRQGDADEIIKRLPMRISKIRSLFKKGRIRDAKTIAALALDGIL